MHGDDGFEGAAELCGYFLAHAVRCIERGETFHPLVGHERDATSEGERAFALLRFDAPTQNEDDQHDLARAVLIHDGYFTWTGVRLDALLARVSDFRRRTRRSLEVVLPYRHPQDAGGFAIHRPKLLRAVGLPETLAPIVRAFYCGVDAHEEGKRSWTRHLDPIV